jgi:hypothetical protein
MAQAPTLDASTPSRFTPEVPNPARVYNVWLGGKDNYRADRQAAAEIAARRPEVVAGARANRAFLAHAVRYLAGPCGIRQFVDIGTGLPTANNTHQVAQAVARNSKIVYVDNDPVARHAEALAGGVLGVDAVRADLRQPWDLFAQPAVRNLINLAEPMVVLLVAALHFVRDHEDPWAVVNCYKDMMAPGSYLVVSHVTADHLSAEAARRAQAVYESASAPGVARTREQVAGFFAGLDMVPPGLVNLTAWRPTHVGPARGPAVFYAGIGRKTSTRRPR